MFRISIKSLFVAISIVAVAFVLTDGVSVRNPAAVNCIFALLLLSLLCGLVVYDKMYCRAFGIGAIPPLLFILAAYILTAGPASSTKISNEFVAMYMILIPVCGCIAMLVRKIVVPKSDDEDLENPRTNLLKELVTGLILGLLLGGLTSFAVQASGIIKPDTNFQEIQLPQSLDSSKRTNDTRLNI